jgi:hypothetical protein
VEEFRNPMRTLRILPTAGLIALIQWCPAKVELLTVTNTYYMG